MRTLLSRILGCAGLSAAFMVSPFWPSEHALAQAQPPMFVTVHEGGKTYSSQDLTLGLGKAAIVELPKAVANVLIANPDVADAIVRTPTRVFVMGMEVGQTNAFFFDRAGNQILNLEIRVERDLAPLNDMFSRLMPGSRLSAEAINESIVLNGSVPNAAAADRAMRLARQFTEDPESVISLANIDANEQVMLKVRVVEMQRTLIKQLGIDLQVAGQIGTTLFNVGTSNPFPVAGQLLGGLGAGAIGGNAPGVTSAFNGGAFSANGLLQAFEEAGLVRTLAEPTLTAISGESANFLAGGEFPVPASQDQNGNVTIEFKPFGVGLGFTPVVLSEGRISLRVSTEVSETSSENAFTLQGATFAAPDGQFFTVPGLTVPSLTVRRAETTVELPSGGAMMMAGLLQETTRKTLDGVPGLKDAPVLGALFSSNDYLNEETELVVIVTPYLVKPVAESELATPADGYAPASDFETYVLRRLVAQYGVNPNPPDPVRFKGATGFIVE